jgi:spermidine synthase
LKTSTPYFLLFTVFVSGLTTLAVEITASRLLGNIFGTSNLVWANIIGLMLLYLAAGYFLGGRWADRSPYPRTFYSILIVAAFLTALVPLVARPVLRFAAGAMLGLDAVVAGGSFLGVLILFSAPVTLLGCASPFAIRLALNDPAQTGAVAGRIYAVSTLGSLAGTFLPVLVLVPTIGTTATFLLFAGLLFVVAFVGLWRVDRRRAALSLSLPAIIAVVAAPGLSGSQRPLPGLIPESEIESAYNFIQVVEHDDTRYLLLNEGQGIHSMYNPNRLETGGTWDYFLAATYFNAAPRAPGSLAVVGLAAGTIPKQYTAVFGPIPIDGIEIDPAIVEVGRRWFNMTEPNLNVIVEDGRVALARSTRRYDVIAVDAYRVPYIPWHLTTREFFEEARAKLADDGVLVINVGRTPGDDRLVRAMVGTLSVVFPSVHVAEVPDSFNSIVYATVLPTRAENLRANLERLPDGAHPLLRRTLARVALHLRPAPLSDTVFTDDLAPVEFISNAIVLDFFLRGGREQLR